MSWIRNTCPLDVASVADPGSGAFFLIPGSGIGKNQDPEKALRKKSWMIQTGIIVPLDVAIIKTQIAFAIK
jgi:hypothetical protein